MMRNSLRIVLIALALCFVMEPGATEAQGTVSKTKQYPTIGNPASALATPDGKYVFVSVTNVNGPNFAGPDATAGARKDVVSGVQIFRSAQGGLLPLGFIRTGGAGANGLVLLPHAKTLVVGVGDAGLAFLDVDAAIRGDAVPIFVSQGAQAGTFDIVASNDGRYVFSANEYGVVKGQRGNVGVTSTGLDRDGRVHQPALVNNIPLGDVVPSLNISPDGSRLYVATELVPTDKTVSIAASGDAALSKTNCVQRKDAPPMRSGYISVVDTQRAIQPGAENAVLARIASGCSPVRIVESGDSSALFVSARGDNVVLEFDSAKLTSDPEHAFRRGLPTGGEAPVGIRLFDQDRRLAVANSNRFATAVGTVALVDLKASQSTSERIEAGQFPRNISSSADGALLYVTNYTSRTLEVIDPHR